MKRTMKEEPKGYCKETVRKFAQEKTWELGGSIYGHEFLIREGHPESDGPSWIKKPEVLERAAAEYRRLIADEAALQRIIALCEKTPGNMVPLDRETAILVFIKD